MSAESLNYNATTQNIMRVGIIGCGAIGAIVHKELQQCSGTNVVGTYVRNPDGHQGSVSRGKKRSFCPDIQALIDLHPTLIVECAGHSAIRAYGEDILRAGIDLLVVSSGVLADVEVYDSLVDAAQEGSSKIRVPAGAVGGLDWLCAGQLSGFSSVVYRSRKPPSAWPEEYLPDTDHTEACVFYRSSVREAAARFPKNVNAAATVALATVGFDNTSIELISDPNTTHNSHEVEAVGKAGSIKIEVSNAADPDNPRTSTITGYSVARSVLRDYPTIVI